MNNKLGGIASATGVLYDDGMLQHRCMWEDHPERPERLTSIMNRCSELGVLDRCVRLPFHRATKGEMCTLHDGGQYDKLAAICNGEGEEARGKGPTVEVEGLQEFASRYDSVYVNKSTLDAARLAAGATLQLVRSIMEGEVLNGMAFVRPPGHHAMHHEYCGYSFFNNVALAARHALDEDLASRILIVDFDVHHGQGTQQAFYDDPRVLYFSTHRYEFGKFWPNLRESDFNWVGQGEGQGYNINVPLNAIGMGDTEFLAVWYQLLLPIAHQFNPDLILVSAGFDSALGDPKGGMRLTPQCYPHLLAPLMLLAEGRVAVVLEGGYCLKALAEGAALCLRTLLGDPCPTLPGPLGTPMQAMVDTLLNCIGVLRDHWTFPIDQASWDGNEDDTERLHVPAVRYDWVETPKPERYPTTNPNPVSSFEGSAVELELEEVIANTDLSVPRYFVGVYSKGQGERCGEQMDVHIAASAQDLVKDVVSGVCRIGFCCTSSKDIRENVLNTLEVGRVMTLTIHDTSPPDGDGLQITIRAGSGADVMLSTTRQSSELAAIFTSLVLPIGYEFGPELVVISNWSDVQATATVIATIIKMLSPLAAGKICVFLQEEKEEMTKLLMSELRRRFLSGVSDIAAAYGGAGLQIALDRNAEHWSLLAPLRKEIQGGGIEIGTYSTEIN